MRYDVLVFKTVDPALQEPLSVQIETIDVKMSTYVSKVFHVPHEIPLRVDNLINSFLPSLLSIRHAIDNLLRN